MIKAWAVNGILMEVADKRADYAGNDHAAEGEDEKVGGENENPPRLRHARVGCRKPSG